LSQTHNGGDTPRSARIANGVVVAVFAISIALAVIINGLSQMGSGPTNNPPDYSRGARFTLVCAAILIAPATLALRVMRGGRHQRPWAIAGLAVLGLLLAIGIIVLIVVPLFSRP
jgi:hypothetical protein